MTPGDLVDRPQFTGPERTSSDRVRTFASRAAASAAHDAFGHRLPRGRQPATRSTSRRRTRSTGRSCRICRFESDLGWSRRCRSRTLWSWSRGNSLVIGFDYERVTSVSRSYTRTGDRAAPFSADSNKRTAGVYAENTLKLWDGRTVVALGGRVRSHHHRDRRRRRSRRTSRRPKATSASSIRASASSTRLVKNLRAHFAIGRALHSGRSSDADRVSRRPSSAGARRSTRAIPI